jgi:CRP/FNR family transcriptional regulator, anaerobic regulatory protein
MQNLRLFIKSISPKITDVELDYVITKFSIKTYSKNKYIIKKQQIASEFIIVKKGCIRIFYLDADKEVNAWFAFENSLATEMKSFITQTPSNYALQAIEDCEVYSISHANLIQLYNQFNNFQVFGFKLTELVLVKTIERITSFQFETAEQRYLKIIHDKNYTQRIPLKDLASFLGLTPNSLSRLRKSFSKK